MGLTVFRMIFEVGAVIFFLIFFVNMEDHLEAIKICLRRQRGVRRQGGDENKSMTKMLEEFIGKPCMLQAEGFDEDEEIVIIQEVDEEWLKVSYMEATDRRGGKKKITRLVRLEDVIGVKMEEEIEGMAMKGGARPEPPEE